jgi:hypothetical protein
MSSDVVLIIASLFIAFVIWLIAKYGQIETDTIAVPVNLVNPPENCEVKLINREVSINVQYPKSLKNYVSPRNFRVVRDASMIIPGIDKFERQFLPITVDDVLTISLPHSVKPIGIEEPKQITVESKYYSEVARVEPRTKGNPDKNYEVLSPVHSKPEQVLVSSAPDLLKSVKEKGGGEIVLSTEEISVEGKRESFPQTVRLLLPEGLKLLHEEDSLVEVIVEIKEKIGRRTISDIPLSLPTFLKGVKIETKPEEVSVTVEAPISLLSQLDEDSFVFSTKQPLDEVPGSEGSFAIEAKFSDSVGREVREHSSIIGVDPEKVDIKFLQK